MPFGLVLAQTQKLALTPQLQQALKILQLPIDALRQEVAVALQENPFLDLDETSSEEETVSAASREEMIWDSIGYIDGDLWDVQERPKSLWSYLIEQLGCLGLPAEEDMRVQWLIGALDEKGFLSESLIDIAKQYPIKENFEFKNWEAALKTLQSFDPTGVGANSVQDCLLIQLRNCQADKDALSLGCQIVEDFFEEFAHKKFDLIRKRTGCTDASLKKAEARIHALNPHPVAEFSPMQINYDVPEVEVYKSLGEWKVRLIQSVLPKMKINNAYALALRDQDNSEDTYRIWQDRL
ncbi:MAG: hypothetical protein LUC43_07905, partial [Burkholderiales bacterium]|nr:hypothetical protein [Burkholderiales bacterium]